MKSLILFDSQFGNTEKIAQAIARGLEESHEVTMLRVSQASADQLSGFDLVVAGSPTQGFRATKASSALLKGLPKNAFKGVKVTAFDTRFTEQKIKESARFLPCWSSRTTATSSTEPFSASGPWQAAALPSLSADTVNSWSCILLAAIRNPES